jgi:cell division protein FtsB
MSDSVHQRNIIALNEAQRHERSARESLAARVVNLEAQVTMLKQEVETLHQRVVLAFSSRGHGPTSR